MDNGAIALAISGGSLGVSLVVAWRTERRAWRAEGREERRDEREEEAAARHRRGNPIVTPHGATEGGRTAQRVHHGYKIQNGGASAISALRLWVEDATGQTVSTVGGGEMSLAPGEVCFMGLDVLPDRITGEGELTLWREWRDDDGEHEEPTGIRPPRHA